MNFETMIQKLPEDIQTHIYKEYVEAKLIYEEYVEAIESYDSRRLNIRLVNKILPRILRHDLLTEYVCRKDPIFQQVFHDHIVRKKYNFEGMDLCGSFALALLMNKYH
jgi:hypothetical protein